MESAVKGRAVGRIIWPHQSTQGQIQKQKSLKKKEQKVGGNVERLGGERGSGAVTEKEEKQEIQNT